MKTAAKCIALFLLLRAPCASAQGGRWLGVARGDSVVAQMDTATIGGSGGERWSVWTLWRWSAPIKMPGYNNVQLVRQRALLDCAGRRTMTLHITLMDAAGSILEAFDSATYTWTTIEPDTIEEAAFLAECTFLRGRM